MTGRRTFAGLGAIAGLALMLAAWSPPLRAQPLIVEKSIQAEAPVFDDNLEDAKRRAIRMAQRELLLGMVKELVAEEWVGLFERELRLRILNRRSRFIQSFLVEKEGTSLDRTQYQVALVIRVHRGRLVEDLQRIPLPLLGETPTALTLFYSSTDPLLRHANLRKEVLSRVRERLGLLKFDMQRVIAAPPPMVEALQDPLADPDRRVELLARYKTAAALYLSFQAPPASTGGNGENPGGKGRALVYRTRDGSLLATLEHHAPPLKFQLPGRNSRERREVMAAWVNPLVLRMQPGAIRTDTMSTSGKAPIQLRVLGLTNVEDQDAFENAFLTRESPFAELRLARISPQSVTYSGPFGGNRATLEQKLSGKTFGDFRVRGAFWYNGVLELDVERRVKPMTREMILFPPGKRPQEVEDMLEEHLRRFAELDMSPPSFAEREDNGWQTRANLLPLNATFYGVVDSREDRDLFVAEALTSGDRVLLTWNRMGRTLLSPVIRIYDEEGALVRTFYASRWLRYEYKVPKDQHRFFVEIADRYGAIQVDTGGYLNFHYLFKAERKGG